MEDAFNTSDNNVNAAYTQSCSMIAWLEYKHPGALLRLIDNLASGMSFETALDKAAGLTPARWVYLWQHAIPPYIVWLDLLNSPIVYAPAALLILIAFIRMRKKREETEEVEEQPEEEIAAVAPVRTPRAMPPPIPLPRTPTRATPPPPCLSPPKDDLLRTPLVADMYTPGE